MAAIPKKLPAPRADQDRRIKASSELYRRLLPDSPDPLFSPAEWNAFAGAARLPLTSAFRSAIRAAVLVYVGSRNWKGRWQRSRAAAQIDAVARAAATLERHLGDLNSDLKLEIERCAARIAQADVAAGKLAKDERDIHKLLIRTSSARATYAMDVGQIVHNPTATYPIEIIRRAAALAAAEAPTSVKIDPLAWMARLLSTQLSLPLTASEQIMSRRAGDPGRRVVSGRLVELLVTLTAALSKIEMPEFDLPSAEVEVGPDGARAAIRRAQRIKD